MTTCSEDKVCDLVLASTSLYRCQQLKQMGLKFHVCASDVQEVCKLNETPVNFALRMAEAKAASVAEVHPDAWVIGADQVCEFEGGIIRKPGSHAAAFEQLRQFSGQEVTFNSAVCVRYQSQTITQITTTKVLFKPLSEELITHYLQHDKPYDCAGSFKVESGGLRLMQSVHSEDPSALIGLPLIALTGALDQLGYAWS